MLVPVIKDMNKRDREGTQSNITRFFGGSVGAGAKEAFAPRQKAQGSKRMAAAVGRLKANAAADESSRTADEDEDAEEVDEEEEGDTAQATRKRTRAS